MEIFKTLMAWNQPGGNQRKDKDNGNNNTPPEDPFGRNKNQGPPDLDQLFRKFISKIKRLFSDKKSNSPYSSFGGGGSGGSGSGGGSGNGSGFFSNQKEFSFVALSIAGALLLLYLLSGIYIVQPPERAVITRFGKYVYTEGPGPHWIPPLIESREIVNVEQVATIDHSGLMLTKDRNIASVGIAVQYRIGDGVDDVRAFLFNVVNPIRSLKQSTESALRQVVGQSTMDEVLTLKRAEISHEIKKQIIETLKSYHTGLMILDVSMQFAKAPDEVRAAFDDVIKAAADEERLVNQARAYENEVLPRARGKVEQLKNEAMAYKQEVILKAEGNVQRFNSILPEYQKAPKVTQTRLYLDTMEQILSRVNKVIMDPNSGNNFIYVPQEKPSNVTENSTLSFDIEPAILQSQGGGGSGGAGSVAKDQASSTTSREGSLQNQNMGSNSRISSRYKEKN